MSRRIVGAILIFTAAFLYGVRYLAAGFFGSSVTSWNEDLFKAMLQSVGPNLVRLSCVALVFGVVYPVWAEVEDILKFMRDKAKKAG